MNIPEISKSSSAKTEFSGFFWYFFRRFSVFSFFFQYRRRFRFFKISRYRFPFLVTDSALVRSRDTVTAVCLTEPHISKPSVNKSSTGVRTLISHHKRRTLVTLKILFFVQRENAWDFHWVEWKRETHRKCVSLTRDAWDLAGLHEECRWSA